MLGFSLGKLLVLAVTIAAVWYGFRLYERRRASRRLPTAQRDGVVDLIRNPRTGTWEPRRRDDQ